MNARLIELCKQVVDGVEGADVALCEFVINELPVDEPPLSLVELPTLFSATVSEYVEGT